MRLYLLRHGAASDVSGRCIGHYDAPLSVSGSAAIERLTPWLPRPDRIVSSDLTRARASAAILARGWDVPVTCDARLREMHFGEWEGVRWDDLERRDGDRLAAWMADWVQVRAPGGESFEDVAARVQDWLTEATLRWTGETVLAVMHAGSIRAFICLWLGLPLDMAFRFRVDPGCVAVSSEIGEGSVIVCDRYVRCWGR